MLHGQNVTADRILGEFSVRVDKLHVSFVAGCYVNASSFPVIQLEMGIAQ
jgi:hypothetical protein